MKKSLLFGLICFISGISVTVIGAAVFNASSVSFTPKNSNWNVNNVDDAINNLYKIYSCGYKIGYSWSFDYIGSEQIFEVPCDGVYKIETWGAQGGSMSGYAGGYGGYSVGNTELKEKDNLYINVGGAGGNTTTGGYNGGGNITSGQTTYGASGGGATHIATKSGLLSTLESSKNNILIVAGGGGGADNRGGGYGDGSGGSGGGFTGGDGETTEATNGYGHGYGTGGTQVSGGVGIWIAGSATGQANEPGVFGSAAITFTFIQAGGGGGFYGGGNGNHGGAGGGSGYIGNSLLSDKSMYCYNCTESNDVSTKTVSNTCTNSTAVTECSKIGNGYAKITLVSIG